MDKFPWLAAETGTMGTTTISLSGTAVSFFPYPSRTVAAAAADANTDFDSGDSFAALVTKDSTNWKLYQGAVWTDASPDSIDLATATVVAAAGTVSAGDTVSVIAVTVPGFIYDQWELPVPSTPTATGVKGSWAADPTTGYYYRWVDTDVVWRFINERSW